MMFVVWNDGAKNHRGGLWASWFQLILNVYLQLTDLNMIYFGSLESQDYVYWHIAIKDT